MENIIYLTITGLGTILVFLAAINFRKEHARHLAILRRLMYLSAVAGVFFFGSILLKEGAAASFCIFIYHCLSTWRNLHFLLFAVTYANDAPLKGYEFYLCIALAIGDNLLHVFDWFGGNHITSRTENPLHLVVGIFFLILFVYTLAKHFVVDPSRYRLQFAVLLALMIIGFGINTAILVSPINMDYSAVIYGLLAASMHYLTTGFIATSLRRDMNAQVMLNSNNAVVLFGEHGRCLYLNAHAKKLFPDLELNTDRSAFEETYFSNESIESISGTVIYFKEETDEETCYLFEFSELHDQKGRHEGCYFLLTDLTRSELRMRDRLLTVSRDHLTGLLNEAGFYEKTARILSRPHRGKYRIITSNITDFKLINELLGREKGDEILSSIGKYISGFVGKDVAASRLEADRFGICLPAHMDIATLERDINTYLKTASSSFSIICDFGVYDIEDESLPVPLMCENANLALATIDKDSEVRIAFYSGEIRDKLLDRNELIADLEPGLLNNEFVLYFQPQVDSFSEKVVGAEALVRWQHPTRGFLSPFFFVELFEEHGKLYDLDAYVWEEACRTIKELHDKGYPVSISVNISPKDIFNHDLCAHFEGLVKKYNLSPKNLKLEITESAVIYDMSILKNLVDRFHEAGFVVEMDDFGSGYSSLNSLKDIPVDIIKTDRIFLKNTGDMSRAKHIFESVLGLARKLGSPIIAEGVEDKEQLEYLKSLGCHNIQGYYYSPPIPLDKFIEFMDSHGVEDIKL